MSLSMADVTLSGFREPNWTYIYLFHIYMRDHVAMSEDGILFTLICKSPESTDNSHSSFEGDYRSIYFVFFKLTHCQD